MLKKFTDQSSATRFEKAKRFLRSLSDPHDYRYFYGDGFPRHAEIQQDAAAALDLLEMLGRNELLAMLRGIVNSEVGRQTQYKLEEGQSTDTEEGKVWLRAIDLVTQTNKKT